MKVLTRAQLVYNTEPREEVYGHPLQYAFVGYVYVGGTEDASDDDVRNVAGLPGIQVERFNRCPTCEQWSPCDVRKAQADG